MPKQTLKKPKKPIRSASGVTVITLLTKPYPCPGRCIFCPTYSNMPKSYIADEPSAQRSLALKFNPFLITLARLLVLLKNGHNVNKAEIIINGGTWSYYPAQYRTYVIKSIFAALNTFTPDLAQKLSLPITKNKLKQLNISLKQLLSLSLEELFRKNTTAYSRAVGISVEERPDTITLKTLKSLRRHGVTKVQVGFQSMDDMILRLNRRDHTVADNIHAANLLRANGFKINAHFMPNLYGATPKKDFESYRKLIALIAPDEVKIYPTVLLKNTQLYKLYLEGKYKQYTEPELIELIAKLKLMTPYWVRINRIFRDIPTPYMQGIKIKSNLREIVREYMLSHGQKCRCIRCRQAMFLLPPKTYSIKVYKYPSQIGENYFIAAEESDKLLGFVRLFLPNLHGKALQLSPIRGHALIREVHVYSQVSPFGKREKLSVQHTGIGKSLIHKAEEISRQEGYRRLSVIAAIGTRLYYEKLGYRLSNLHYMTKQLG